MLKFIRVSLRDDYSVKLRVIGYRWNPCEVTPELSMDFSNMITSRSGRSDLTQLLEQENNRGSKNGIKIGTGSAESAQEYCNALMELLKNNSIFTRAVQGIAGGVSGTLDIGAVQGIVSQSAIPIMNIVGTSEQLAEFITKNITDNAILGLSGNAIATKILEADEGFFNTITTNVLRIGKDGITEITKDAIKTETINVKQIVGEAGDFDTLVTRMFTANHAQISQLITDFIEAGQIVANEINVKNIIGDRGEFNEFFVTNFHAEDAEIQTLIAGAITADTIAAKLGEFTQANIGTLFANTAFIERLTSFTNTTATSVINDAYIQNAVINKVSIADLAAGNITLTDTMKILSENGNMVMDGSVLQFGKINEEGDFDVNIQIGYGTDEKPSLIIRDENGAALFTSQGYIDGDGNPVHKGISSSAIADGLIVNTMIRDGTIDKSKLGFSIIEPNAQGGIDIRNIYNGDGGRFGDEWISFKQQTQSALDELAQNTAGLDLSGNQIFKEVDGEIIPDQITLYANIRGDVEIVG